MFKVPTKVFLQKENDQLEKKTNKENEITSIMPKGRLRGFTYA